MCKVLVRTNPVKKLNFSSADVYLTQGSQTHIDLRATFQMKNDPRAAIRGKTDSAGEKTNKSPQTRVNLNKNLTYWKFF
jgi:hypothetical protein